MGMHLRYGNYIHDADEVVLGVNTRTLETDGGIPYEMATSWNIEGVILPSSGGGMASILAKKALMQTAYSSWFRDAVFYDDATGYVAHSLINARSARGVKVLSPPSFPADPGPSLVTGLRYSIQLQAEFAVANTAGLYRSFQETLSFRGGGAIYGIIPTVNRPAVRFTKARFSPYYATQSGSATGYMGYPQIPAPIWPGALVDEPQTSRQAPQYQGGKFQNFSVSWSYSFASATPLIANPNRQPTG